MKNNLNLLDRSNLRQVILEFPRQFSQGLKLAKDISLKGKFESVCVSGMGGSSLPVDVLRTYVEDLEDSQPGKNVPFTIYQNRTYSLPPEAKSKKCLNIFSSFSGGTEETISSLNEAIRLKLPAIVITNGGKMQEIAEKNRLPFIKLPFVIQPRYATGYFFSSMLQILSNVRLVTISPAKIVSGAKKLEQDASALEPRGKILAKKISGKTPIIHAPEKFRSVAMIWKIKINENAKTPAFYNAYPEMSHNEMVGFTLPQGKFHILSLINNDDHPQNVRRIRITAGLLKKYGVDTTAIDFPKKDMFQKIFSMLILGDWISYYLALEYGQDPTPVDMVEKLKKMLA